jgi:tetratricopeptide (TPR) repeat protein
MAAHKGIEDAVAQLRSLAVALTDRRKQTEATLAQIQGLGEPQNVGLTDADIAKLEAGLAAAIEKATTASKQAAQAPTAPPTPPPAAVVKPNGATTAPDVAVGKVAAKPEPAKAEPAKAEPAKPEPAKPEPAKAEAPKAEPPKVEPAKPQPAKVEPAKPEPAKAEAPKATDKAPAAKANDNTPHGVFARGIAQLEENKPQEALKTLEPLQANPEFAVLVQTAIGRCYAQLGQLDEAQARYAKALEVSGHPEEQYHEALYYMAAAHESRNDDESRELATWALEEIFAANPKYRDVGARLDSLKAQAGKAAAGGPA